MGACTNRSIQRLEGNGYLTKLSNYRETNTFPSWFYSRL